MTPGKADQSPRFGLAPRLLTAIPIGVLAVTGIVQWASGPHRVVPVAESEPSRTATPAPETPAPAPAPALEVTPADSGAASVWTPPAAQVAAPAVASAASSWGDVPTAAQVAYQRASTVIDSADPACHLDWSVLAAVGKIESDHGRAHGGQLDDNGLETPAIVGPALTGAGGTLLVADTDGGSLDGDPHYDHAVGPMQFLPATWTTVGVDADGDGQRNPQDLDDAALAAAVYLCSGTEDLATPEGRQAAVFSYNHSQAYVDQVLASAAGYQSGFESGTGIVTTAYLGVSTRNVAPAVEPVPAPAPKRHRKKHVAVAAVVKAATPVALPPKTAVGGAPVTPTDPVTPTEPATPAPTPATADELTTLAHDAITEAYPDATDAALDEAVDTVVEKLDGFTLAEATEAVDDLVAKLAGTIEGLEPADEPEDPTQDPTDGSGQADQPAGDTGAGAATGDQGDTAPAEPAS